MPSSNSNSKPGSSKKSAEDFNDDGLEKFNAQKYKEALEAFQTAAQMDPIQASYQKNLAETYYRLGEIQKSISHYQRAIWLDHNRADFYNELALIYMNQNHLRTSLTLFSRAAELDPDNDVYLENQANTLRKMKEYHQALRLYQKMLHKTPQSAKIHNGIGGCHFGLAQYCQAIPFFKRAYELDSKNWLYLQNLADSYRNNKDYIDAIAEYERLLKETPTDSLSWNFLGVCYMELDDLKNSKRCFKRAVDLDGSNANYAINLGNAYRVSSNYKSAIAAYERARKLVEYNPYIENALAMTHFHLQDFVEARRIYEELLSREPTNSMLNENFVEVLMHMKAFGSAKAWIERVMMRGELEGIKLPSTEQNTQPKIQTHEELPSDAELDQEIEDLFDLDEDTRQGEAPPAKSANATEVAEDIEVVDLPKTTTEAQTDKAYNFHLLGLCYENLGQLETASIYHRLAAQNHPQNRDFQTAINVNSVTKDHSSKQLEILRKRLEKDPTDLKMQYALGEMLLTQGKYSEAMEFLKMSAKADPPFALVFYYLALSEFTLANYKKCLQWLDKHAKIHQYDWRADLLKARASFALGDMLTAKEAFDAAKMMNPQLIGFVHDLAELSTTPAQEDTWFLMTTGLASDLALTNFTDTASNTNDDS